MSATFQNHQVLGRSARSPYLSKGKVIFATIVTEEYAGSKREPFVSYVDFRVFVQGESDANVARVMRALEKGNSVAIKQGRLQNMPTTDMVTKEDGTQVPRQELVFVVNPNDIEINAYTEANKTAGTQTVTVEAEAVPVNVPVQ